MLHGHARLEFARERKVGKRIRREVVNVIEHDNTITPWTDDVLNDGNFHYQIQPSKLMPISQFFDGCLLTDKVNVASLSMIAGDSEVTAMAGKNSYSGLNEKRGTYNQIESGNITGGIRQVWDWGTAYGNGPIASVCLTRSKLGEVEMHDDDTAFESTEAYIDEIMNSSYSAPNMVGVNIFSNAGRYAYRVYYEDSKIKIQEYDINNELLIVRGGVFEPVPVGTPHVINEALTDSSTASVSFTETAFHVIETNGGTMKIITIDASDWSSSTATYTFENISFVPARTHNAKELPKDVHIISGNYVYTYATVGEVVKFVKCNLTNVSDVDEYTVPSVLATMTASEYHGAGVLLPNGDIFKPHVRNNLGTAKASLYFHNGKAYAAYSNINDIDSNSGVLNYGLNVIKGGLVVNRYGWEYRDSIGVLNIHPYVSTVNNLDEAVMKTASLTMKLTYDLTEE
jgi:hypothetical protein